MGINEYNICKNTIYHFILPETKYKISIVINTFF